MSRSAAWTHFFFAASPAPAAETATAYAPAPKPGKTEPDDNAPMALSGAISAPDDIKAALDDPKAARAKAKLAKSGKDKQSAASLLEPQSLGGKTQVLKKPKAKPPA